MSEDHLDCNKSTHAQPTTSVFCRRQCRASVKNGYDLGG